MRRNKRRKLRRKGMKYLGSSENSSRRTRPPHVHLTTLGSWSTSSSHGGLISTSFFSSRSFLRRVMMKMMMRRKEMTKTTLVMARLPAAGLLFLGWAETRTVGCHGEGQ